MDILKTTGEQVLYLHRDHWQQMLADVNHRAPIEACGLMAGLARTSLAVFPMTNVLQSPLRYNIDPKEQFEIFKEIDQHQWELIAIYHSHPSGPASPSATDVAEAYYPDTVYLIWSRNGGTWQCRGFIINDGEASEVSLYIYEDQVQRA